MNNKQQVINKLLERSNIDVLKKLRQSFIDEDKAEPFFNREYAGETIRIFDMLIEGYDELSGSPTNRAINDIVSDIFRHFTGEYI